MTLNAYFLEKPTCRRESWLTKSTYPQNIQRTSATLVNKRSRWPACRIAHVWKSGTRRPVSRVLCRPPPRSDGHWRSFLWTAPRGTVLATYPDRSGLRQPYPPCGGRTVPIRSCSWRGLPCRPCYQARGGLLPHPFTLTPDESGAVCSLWRYPWGHPRRALPAAMSSWSPDFPRPPCGDRDRPAVWSARNVRVRARGVKPRG
jgi:hypothetical protein